jgi:hypothetical protein
MVIASHPPARTALVRSVLLFSPFLVIVLAAFVALIAGDVSGGAVIGVVVVALVALLLAYQVVQTLRDLLTRPIETVGLVERHWNRNEFFLFRNTYIFVEGDVYRLSPEQELHVEIGHTVRVRHYPHTGTVDAIEVLEPAAKGGSSDV